MNAFQPGARIQYDSFREYPGTYRSPTNAEWAQDYDGLKADYLRRHTDACELMNLMLSIACVLEPTDNRRGFHVKEGKSEAFWDALAEARHYVESKLGGKSAASGTP